MNFEKPKRFVDRVFLHCSASEKQIDGQALVDEIRRWHTDPKPKGNGWNDIGYQYVIDKKGACLLGRDLEKQPAAQYPYNPKTIAICVHGLLFEEWYDTQQADATRQLCSSINESYSGLIRFIPHNRVNLNKTCPVFDVKKLLKTDRWDRMP